MDLSFPFPVLLLQPGTQDHGQLICRKELYPLPLQVLGFSPYFPFDTLPLLLILALLNIQNLSVKKV